ncbi:hypothetical protein, partial [Brucella anthropi]|uniref:hypothetical protein n=1 Tax=Brucella anthropi TaxID=529 RepID=UPI001AEC4479
QKALRSSWSAGLSYWNLSGRCGGRVQLVGRQDADERCTISCERRHLGKRARNGVVVAQLFLGIVAEGYANSFAIFTDEFYLIGIFLAASFDQSIDNLHAIILLPSRMNALE